MKGREPWLSGISSEKPKSESGESLLGLTAKTEGIPTRYLPCRGKPMSVGLTEGTYLDQNKVGIALTAGATGKIMLSKSSYCRLVIGPDGSWELLPSGNFPVFTSDLRYFYAKDAIRIWVAIDLETPLPPGSKE